MDISKNNANIATYFPVNLFPIKIIISFNLARYLRIRLVKQSPQPKIMQMDFFSKYIGSIIPSVRLHVNASQKDVFLI